VALMRFRKKQIILLPVNAKFFHPRYLNLKILKLSSWEIPLSICNRRIIYLLLTTCLCCCGIGEILTILEIKKQIWPFMSWNGVSRGFKSGIQGVSHSHYIANPSGTPEFTPALYWGSCCSILSFLCNVL
jgi:hypothetical protein